MKKKLSTCLTILLSLLLAVNVWADAGREQEPDYVTDYYMIVESAEGGVNIYPDINPDSHTLNNELIPNGTALHIEGEKKGDNNREWGYTQYHGMYGYVPLDDLKPGTLSEAVESDYRLAKGRDADYDVEVKAADGSTFLRKGPGEKYGEISGGELPNGEKLHVSREAEMEDGRRWGYASDGEREGWLNLEDTKDWIEKQKEQPAKAKTAELTAAPEKAPDKKAEPTAAPAPTATITPKATETPAPTATETPEAAATETPEAAATETPAPTATETPKATEKPDTTEAPKQKAEASPAEKAQNASGKDVKASSSWVKSPVVWGTSMGLLAVILLLLFFLKKKK